MLNNDQIYKMVLDIIQNVDSDIYKDFKNIDYNDPDEAAWYQDVIGVAKMHLGSDPDIKGKVVALAFQFLAAID